MVQLHGAGVGAPTLASRLAAGREGLSEAEARARRARGLGNDAVLPATRSYGQIVRDNAFMSINVIIFTIGIVLILMGLINDAIVTVGLVLLIVAIAVFQEVRAKRALDRIALLTRLTATVVRDGAARTVDPAEIVQGDLVLAGPGDQVMVDGRVVADGQADLDESLLTGESEPVRRVAGDPVYSGSFVVSGGLLYEAEQVGMASMANALTARARVFRPTRTPLQREVDLVLRLMVVLILVLGGPIVIDLAIRVLGLITAAIDWPIATRLERAYQGYSVQETVRAAAVVVNLLPQGLALMLSVSYALGAVRLSGSGAVLQRANAVESMSHVDVLCFDKTGTLTTNRLAVEAAHPLTLPAAALDRALADYAASTPTPNRTIEAIAAAFAAAPRPLAGTVPFSSARKWSALAYADEPGTAWVLGAPEMVTPDLRDDPAAAATVDDWIGRGLRVLALARVDGAAAGRLLAEETLPDDRVTCGLVSFRDELQPDTAGIVRHFADAGVALKIISGDNPETVAALARQAGFAPDRAPRLVSGIDLAAMHPAERAEAAERAEVFGRISPEQKLEIVRDLQRRGHYVAMVGDGVNDVLALKQAQLGIAMEQGSQASRAVADVVLLRNAFAVLPRALQEGQRIVRGAQDLLKLFLARSLSMAVAILGAGVLGAAFPLIPTHNALPAVLTVGLPTVALAAWAKPGPSSGVLLRSVLPFALPAALTMGAVEVMVFISYLRITGDVTLARTVLTTVAVLCGLVLILFVEPPTPAWTGGDTLSGDWKPVALVLTMLAAFVVVMTQAPLRDFFELAPLSVVDVVAVLLAVTTWGVGLRTIWRADLLRRWLGLDLGEGRRGPAGEIP